MLLRLNVLEFVRPPLLPEFEPFDDVGCLFGFSCLGVVFDVLDVVFDVLGVSDTFGLLVDLGVVFVALEVVFDVFACLFILALDVEPLFDAVVGLFEVAFDEVDGLVLPEFTVDDC